MAALICLGVFLIEPLCTVLFRVVLAMYQAIAGVLQPATDRATDFWHRATSWLLIGSLICLALGMMSWTMELAIAVAWLVWLIGAIGLLIAGMLGSLLEVQRTE